VNLRRTYQFLTRSARIPVLAFLLASAAFPSAGRGATGEGSEAGAAAEQAVNRGIQWLRSVQRKDGAIATDDRNETAMTSLALLAFASAGHQAIDPTPEGEAMRNALAFVLREDRQQGDGYFGQTDGSRMYGHGITTLMLAEMLGMGVDREQDRLLRRRCTKAVELILRSQQAKQGPHRGGWRYTPESRDADLSVTVWQLAALRSARNAGLEISKKAIDDGIDYVKRSFRPEQERREGGGMPIGGFSYQADNNETRFSTTAQGLLALQVCGQYDGPEVEGAANRLLTNTRDQTSKWFYYATYYYSKGMYQRGGKHADAAEHRVLEVLLPRQRPDGSWPAEGEEQKAGPVYSTSLAVLSLAVRHHFLPIYER
jgi:squalene cyclase